MLDVYTCISVDSIHWNSLYCLIVETVELVSVWQVGLCYLTSTLVCGEWSFFL